MERTKTAFLLLPKAIGDECRWLETASWKEAWDGDIEEWCALEWVNP